MYMYIMSDLSVLHSAAFVELWFHGSQQGSSTNLCLIFARCVASAIYLLRLSWAQTTRRTTIVKDVLTRLC